MEGRKDIRGNSESSVVFSASPKTNEEDGVAARKKVEVGLTKISWPTYILVCLFGVGSWLAINGIWNELPILVNHAPEQWNLPSYLVVITQLANVGPLIYSMGNKFAPKIVHERTAVYAIITLGATACFLLAFYWNKTSFVFGAERSTALMTLSFFVALVDCTSTVVFLPFMAIFPAVYMSALFTGENFSSLLPSVVALVQGVDKKKTIVNRICHNVTVDNVTLDNVPLTTVTCNNVTSVVFTELDFSPDYFFVFLALLMLTCGAAFLAINFLPSVKKHHVMKYSELQKIDRNSRSTSGSTSNLQRPLLQSDSLTENDAPYCSNEDVSLKTMAGGRSRSFSGSRLCKKNGEFLYLLALQAWINCISNGVVSQLSSFACEPYGASTYHLAVTLGGISSALVCIFYILISTKSTKIISLCCFLYTVCSGYVIVIAAQSPNPVLKDSTVGDFLVVSVTILSGMFVSYAKISICTVMRIRGHRDLFWCGVAIQVGSFIGAVVVFPLVNILKLFKQ